ncbi:MAG: hypothetical protein ACTSP4_07350 [Candidatus Hodarchaeales archaeon]
MTKTVSTRLDEEELERLNEIARIENIDRSSLIRKFLLKQMKEYRMKEISVYYSKGIVSLQEAASAVNVSLYEMMDYVQKEKIRPPVQTKDEITAELARSREILLKKRKSD